MVLWCVCVPHSPPLLPVPTCVARERGVDTGWEAVPLRAVVRALRRRAVRLPPLDIVRRVQDIHFILYVVLAATVRVDERLKVIVVVRRPDVVSNDCGVDVRLVELGANVKKVLVPPHLCLHLHHIRDHVFKRIDVLRDIDDSIRPRRVGPRRVVQRSGWRRGCG